MSFDYGNYYTEILRNQTGKRRESMAKAIDLLHQAGDPTTPPELDTLERLTDEYERTQPSEISKGWESGLQNLQATGYGVLGLAGSAVGSDKLRDYGYEGYRRNMEEAAEVSPRVSSVTDIESFGDAADWVMGTVGQLAPSLLEAAASVVAGGGAAGLAGKTVLKNRIKAQIGKEMAKGISEEAARKAVASSLIQAGKNAGLVAGVGAIEAGGNFGEAAGEVGVENVNPVVAGGMGLASGATELVSPTGLFLRKAGRGMVDDAAKKLTTWGTRGLSIPKEMIKEGTQEVVQEGLSDASKLYHNPDADVSGEDYLNSFAAGAVGGGFPAGINAGLSALGKSKLDNSTNMIDSAKGDVNQQTADQIKGEEQPVNPGGIPGLGVVKSWGPEQIPGSGLFTKNLPDERPVDYTDQIGLHLDEQDNLDQVHTDAAMAEQEFNDPSYLARVESKRRMDGNGDGEMPGWGMEAEAEDSGANATGSHRAAHETARARVDERGVPAKPLLYDNRHSIAGTINMLRAGIRDTEAISGELQIKYGIDQESAQAVIDQALDALVNGPDAGGMEDGTDIEQSGVGLDVDGRDSGAGDHPALPVGDQVIPEKQNSDGNGPGSGLNLVMPTADTEPDNIRDMGGSPYSGPEIKDGKGENSLHDEVGDASGRKDNATPKPGDRRVGNSKPNDHGVDPDQQQFIQNKVQSLGSIEAADKYYFGKDEVAKYGRQHAREIFTQGARQGVESDNIPKQTEKPKSGVQKKYPEDVRLTSKGRPYRKRGAQNAANAHTKKTGEQTELVELGGKDWGWRVVENTDQAESVRPETDGAMLGDGPLKSQIDGPPRPEDVGVATDNETPDKGQVAQKNPGKVFDGETGSIKDRLKSGESFKTIREARKAVEEETGESVRPGTTKAKEADEHIELSAVQVAREIAQGGGTRKEKYKRLVELHDQMPNLSVRTSTSVREQAYSTPLPLAYVASELAGITQGKTVYEPTAGNGALVIGAGLDANVNELNESRHLNLVKSGFKNATKNDASEWAPGAKADVVIANPPFGIVKDSGGSTKRFQIDDNYTTSQIDHAIAIKSLEAMKDSGSAVLIVGSVKGKSQDGGVRKRLYRRKDKRDFYHYLYNNYNVIDHFTVDGKLYSKQGASWPVDVISIKGRGKSAKHVPGYEAPRVITSYEELGGFLDENNIVVPEGSGRESDTGSGNQGGARDTDKQADIYDASGGQGAGPVGGQRRKNPDGNSRVDAGSRDTANVNRGPGQKERHVDINREQPTPVRRNGGDGGMGQSPDNPDNKQQGSRRDLDPGRNRGDRELAVKPPRIEQAESSTQSRYTPKSRSTAIGTLTPVNMQKSIGDALDKLSSDGDIDSYVAKELNYPQKDIPKYFSAEQVDAIALALSNMNNDAGFIIGDQTGIGKGRVVAAIIRHSMINGKMPIFITEKPVLYKDMYRDLTDIGMGEDVYKDIFITNGGMKLNLDEDGKTFIKTPPATTHNANLLGYAGGEEFSHKAVFTTYDQLNEVGSARRAFVESMVQRNGVLILDESHNAGGAGASARPAKRKDGKEAYPRAKFLRDMIKKASGVFYSSATYAKRPDVMDLYSKTDIRLAVEDIKDLPETIQKGGIPLQQVVATMLTRGGQYVRRERSFEGVSYDTVESKVDHKQAGDVSTALREINEFDSYVQAAIGRVGDQLSMESGGASGRKGTGQSGITSTNFSSVMHNLIDQMLLSIKTDAAINEAKKALESGEKVVITLANTMGSFIDDYAAKHDLKPGDTVGLTFNEMLDRYLEKTREYTEGKAYGKKETKYLSNDQLGPEGLAKYRAVKKLIAGFDLGSMPVSPIDYIKFKLGGFGYSVDEITGRTTTLEYSDSGQSLSGRKNDLNARSTAITGFNDGSIDCLILNRSGSTGISLHASERNPEAGRQKRRMIVLQAEKNIDTHMQMLGRVHRTGQVVAPAYSQLIADIPAEKRPAAVLSAKMASLNANTTASRDSDFKSKESPDFINRYGDIVVASVMENYEEIHKKLGSPLKHKEKGDGYQHEDAAKKVTGRIPLLSLKEQEVIYSVIESEYEDYISQLDAMGENMLEAKTLDLDAKTKAKAVIFEANGDSPFQENAVAEKASIKRIGKPYTSDFVKKAVEKELSGKTGAEHSKAIIEPMKEKAVDYGNSLLESIENDETKESTRDRLNNTFSRWSHLMRTLTVGGSYSVSMPNATVIIDGVLLKIEQKGKPKNPVALGTWKAVFALADGSRRISVPFTRLENTTTPQDNTIGYSKADQDNIPLFDQAQTTTRENRIIITGNILAGYDQFKAGRIINYTNDKGQVTQGILMPAGFNLEKEMSSKDIVFKTMEQAARFLSHSHDSIIKTKDFALTIKPHGHDGYKISTAASKMRGGKYYLNESIVDAVGEDFVKSGGDMVARFDGGRLNSVLDAIMATGEKIVAPSELSDQAREITGQKVPAFKASGAPKKSVSTTTTTPSTLSELSTKQRRALTALTQKGKVEVIPAHEAEGILTGDAKGVFESGGKTQGFFLNGKAYIIPENIQAGKLWPVLRHEVGVHMGQLMQGRPEFNRILKILENLKTKDTAQGRKVKEAFDMVPKDTKPEHVSEEALAYLVESSPEIGIVRRFITMLKRLLVKLGVNPKIFTQEDYAAMADGALRKEAKRSAGIKKGDTMKSTRLYSNEWFSQMREVLSDKLPGRGTGKAFLDSIRSWVKKGEFKREEFEWSGLEDWLKERDGKVSKQDVLDYLAENDVRVEESWRGRPLGYDESKIDNKNLSKDDLGGFEIVRSGKDDDSFGGVPVEQYDVVKPDGEVAFSELYYEDAVDYVFDELAKKEGYDSVATQYDEYQLPGGGDYKELLLTMPLKNEGKWEVFDPKDGKPVAVFEKESEAQAEAEKRGLDYDQAGKDTDTNVYKSSHWDKPNVLAHVRLNERTGPNGEKVLFIEEIQSDWHQEGRESGYRGKNDIKPTLDDLNLDQLKNVYICIDYDGYLTLEDEERADRDELLSIMKDNLPHWSEEETSEYIIYYARARSNIDGVPDAPFKKTWPLLAFKRMVRYAAENGFDTIAWTPGEVQADRYDLSKQVDSVRYTKTRSVSGEVYSVSIVKDGSTIDHRLVKESELSGYIGKEVAEKIIEGEGKQIPATRTDPSGTRELSGIDLKVGGEGMKGFYDKILPAEVNKFFNKTQWGKAKVGQTEIEDIKAWSIPVTTEMKEKAMFGGMPLFSRAQVDGSLADALDYAETIKDKFGTIKTAAKGAWKDRKYKHPADKDDITWLSKSFGLVSHYAKAVPAFLRTFNHALKMQDLKVQIEQELTHGVDESGNPEKYVETFKAFRKKAREEYQKLSAYLDRTDARQIFWRVKEVPQEDLADGWTEGYQIIDPSGTAMNHVAQDENEAWEKIYSMEADRYVADGGTPEAARVLQRFRTINDRAFQMRVKGIRELQALCEEQNMPEPSIVEYVDGKQVQVDLKAALVEMGSHRGYYMPRIRKQGDWTLWAEKEGENPILVMHDSKWVARGHKNILQGKGYKVTLKQSGQLSEDLYAELGSVLAQQAAINKSLQKVESGDKKLNLGDLGIEGKWEGKDFVVSGEVMAEIGDALKSIGAKRKERSGPTKGGGERFWVEYRFEDADKSIEKKATDLIFKVKGVVPDIAFQLAQAMASQYADILRSRGSRSAMIARKQNYQVKEKNGEFSVVYGTDLKPSGHAFPTRGEAMDKAGELNERGVTKGYEEDAITRVTKSAFSLAGGEAKKQTAINMLRAISGHDITWDQFQEIKRFDGGYPEFETQLLSNDLEYIDRETFNEIKDNWVAAPQYEDYVEFLQGRGIDPAKQKTGHAEAMALYKDMMRNEERVDRVIGTLKGLAVLKYLGFRVAAPVVNMTNMVVGVPAAMKGYGDIPIRQTGKLIGTSYKEFRKFHSGTLEDSELSKVFTEIEKRGWDQAQFNQEAVSVLQGQFGHRLSQVIDLSMKMFSWSEKLNRVATISAAYKGLVKSKPDLTFEERLNLAKEISDKAHGIYTKANRPSAMRGGGIGANALQTAYVFKTFTHNFVNTMADLGYNKKEYTALAWMAFSPVIFGAGSSMGAMALIKVIGTALDSDDPEEDFYKMVKNTFGSYAGDFARFGMFQAGGHGINLKGSLSIGVADLPTSFKDLAGAPGSVLTDVFQGLKEMGRGNVSKGIEKTLPLAFSAPFKAYRESTEGITTKSNAPVFYQGEPLKADAIDAFLRFFSFNPSRIAGAREELWSERKRKYTYQDMRSDIYARLKKHYLGKRRNRNDLKDIEIMIAAYNARAKESGQTLITRRSVKSVLKRAKVE